jgi:hypothetical protein
MNMEHTDQSLSTRDLATPKSSPEAGSDRDDDARGRAPVADRETIVDAEHDMPVNQGRRSAQPVEPAFEERDLARAADAPLGEQSSPINTHEDDLRTASGVEAGGESPASRAIRPTSAATGEEHPDTVPIATNQASSPTTAPGGPAASDSQPRPDIGADSDGTLLSPELSADFHGRWETIQTQFVDEPRGAVQDADKLVATVMQKLAEGFAQERERLEAQWDQGEDISTEDLRVALRRYRSFFQRLLSA